LAAPADELSGLKAGAKAPAIALTDQNGKAQSLQSLSGPNGLLLLFFRSADWCPFCKGELVDLEAAKKAFAARGVKVAAVSYDSAAILADFAQRRSITYPLLSDPKSALIDAFGIRNPEATGMQAGIPYPGFYLISPQGVIQQRFFGSGYINRLTANNIYETLYRQVALPAASHKLSETPHVEVTLSQSDIAVTLGAVVRIQATLVPGPDTHIYAPGADKLDYRVVNLKIDPSNLYKADAVAYPQSEQMSFPSLNQVVPVYTGETILSTEVAAQVGKDTFPIFAKDPNFVVKGELEYQACTSAVCFPPVKTPVEWTIQQKPVDRERVPEAIQHK
jgi:peroxiredoxin